MSSSNLVYQRSVCIASDVFISARMFQQCYGALNGAVLRLPGGLEFSRNDKTIPHDGTLFSPETGDYSLS